MVHLWFLQIWNSFVDTMDTEEGSAHSQQKRSLLSPLSDDSSIRKPFLNCVIFRECTFVVRVSVGNGTLCKSWCQLDVQDDQLYLRRGFWKQTGSWMVSVKASVRGWEFKIWYFLLIISKSTVSINYRKICDSWRKKNLGALNKNWKLDIVHRWIFWTFGN
jgi:hypothetical protein